MQDLDFKSVLKVYGNTTLYTPLGKGEFSGFRWS